MEVVSKIQPVRVFREDLSRIFTLIQAAFITKFRFLLKPQTAFCSPPPWPDPGFSTTLNDIPR